MLCFKGLFLFIFVIFSTEASPNQSDEFSKGVTHFASDFYAQCVKSKAGNVIVSPLSVASSLALLSLATSGSTFDELRNGLHLTGDKVAVANQFHEYFGQLQKSVGGSTLSMANQIYVKQGDQLNKDFQEVAATKFASGVESMDFVDTNKSAEIINHFVEEKTNKMVKNFIKPNQLTADTEAFLVNAIYFKGTWEERFDPEDTFESGFYISETETVPAQYMANDGVFNHAYLADLEASALEMKYVNSQLSFVAVLPKSRTGLAALEAKMKNYELADITSQLNPHIVFVMIPKFKIEYEIELNDVLKEMVMGEIFSDHADLKELLASGDSMKISQVRHKAVIEVNESGSEAAAATGDGVVAKMSIPEFHAKNPFMFFIRDTESNTIIFSGRVENTYKN